MAKTSLVIGFNNVAVDRLGVSVLYGGLFLPGIYKIVLDYNAHYLNYRLTLY